MTRNLIGAVLVGLFSPLTLTAEEAPSPSQDEAPIRKAVQDYVTAFNQHDAKKLAASWSSESVYTNRTTGEQVVGHKAIEEQFVAMFKEQSNLKLDVSVDSIQFVSPNVAVEHGVAKLLQPEAEPEEVDYTAVYVRRDGKWLLDRVTDEAVTVVPSHYEQLKDIEWMIGSWVDEDENARIVTECNWTRNQNFITRSFTVSVEDRIDMAGMQIIGWDPVANQIRSWAFDSDGGFAEGVWTHKDDRWMIRKTGVLTDGRKASSVNIVTYLDDNSFTLQSVARAIDGEILPNIDEVRIIRQGQ